MRPSFSDEIENEVVPQRVDLFCTRVLDLVEPVASILVSRVFPFRSNPVSEEHEAVHRHLLELSVPHQLDPALEEGRLLDDLVFFELQELADFRVWSLVPKPGEVSQPIDLDDVVEPLRTICTRLLPLPKTPPVLEHPLRMMNSLCLFHC